MTDTVDKSIDEILRYFRGWVSLAGNSGEPMYKLGEYEQGELDEAKQAIKDLIATEVLRAKIEQLKHLKGHDSFNEAYTTDPRPAKLVTIYLAELEAQLNKSFSYQITKSNKEIKTQLEDKS
jgi:hypothetical protein